MLRLNKESKSQQAVEYSLSLKLEKNRSKLRDITSSLSNKKNLRNIILSSILIISGCATTEKNISSNTNGFDRKVIETYRKELKEGDKIESADFSYIDSDNNGEFDKYVAKISITNEKYERELNLEYFFTNNNISNHVHIMTEFSIKKPFDLNNKIESEMIKYFDYKGDNYKGKKVKKLEDLPEFKNYQPDGTFDLKVRIKTNIVPEENNPRNESRKFQV